METPEPPVITTAQASYGCHKKQRVTGAYVERFGRTVASCSCCSFPKGYTNTSTHPKKIIMTNTNTEKKRKAEGHFSNKIILQRHKDSAKKGT